MFVCFAPKSHLAQNIKKRFVQSLFETISWSVLSLANIATLVYPLQVRLVTWFWCLERADEPWLLTNIRLGC